MTYDQVAAKLYGALYVFEISEDELHTMTQAQLKKKYIELVKENHPDKGGSTKITAKINESFSLLSDYLQFRTSKTKPTPKSEPKPKSKPEPKSKPKHKHSDAYTVIDFIGGGVLFAVFIAFPCLLLVETLTNTSYEASITHSSNSYPPTPTPTPTPTSTHTVGEAPTINPTNQDYKVFWTFRRVMGANTFYFQDIKTTEKITSPFDESSCTKIGVENSKGGFSCVGSFGFSASSFGSWEPQTALADCSNKNEDSRFIGNNLYNLYVSCYRKYID